MADKNYQHPETIIQHLGEEVKPHGAVVPPIYQNSLFVFDDTYQFESSFQVQEPKDRRHNYSRISNPTLDIAEAKIAALERMEAAKVFGSGMAAICAAIFSAVEAGSHLVCVDTAYGPARQLISDYLPRFGVSHTFVSGMELDEIVGACKPETKLIYLESPSSLIFQAQDFEGVAKFAKENGIATAADNSYSSPMFQTPGEFGIDMILHSATKYLAGHSDVVAGALACSWERMRKIMNDEIPLFGGALAPFPAWLLIRGMRTLPLRMKHAQEAGNRMFEWLSKRPEVEMVFHAGAPDHPMRGLLEKQMRGTSSLLSFLPMCQDLSKLRSFSDALQIFQLGVSWGGFESLCVPIKVKPMGWSEERFIIRLYVGLENAEDLEQDLDQAMAELRS